MSWTSFVAKAANRAGADVVITADREDLYEVHCHGCTYVDSFGSFKEKAIQAGQEHADTCSFIA